MAFNPTDLPDPVVPATNKCGILARSTTIGFPEMSWPKAKLRFEGDDLNAFEDNISVSLTIFLLLFGISIPTKDLPSITSTTLTLLTESDLAMSWAIPVILLAFVPGAGWISNRVTTGPGSTDSTVASIPNSSNFVSNNWAIWFNSDSDNELPSSRALSNSSVLGIIVLIFLSSSDSASFCFGTSFSGVSFLIGRSACFKSELIWSIFFSLICGSLEIFGLISAIFFLSLFSFNIFINVLILLNSELTEFFKCSIILLIKINP